MPPVGGLVRSTTFTEAVSNEVGWEKLQEAARAAASTMRIMGEWELPLGGRKPAQPASSSY